MSVKNIGIPGVTPPTKTCEDANCPYHGKIKLRGRILSGVVTSTKMNSTVVVQRNFTFYIKKYQRYERRNSKIAAHLPHCIEVEVGDTVRIAESKKISKTVNFIVIDKVSEEK